MKTFIIIVLVACAAYVAAGPATSPHIDIYRNILEASSGRVVGGENAVRLQFPYQASLLWSSSGSSFSHICGGTLISKRWVLTAGHCKVYSYGNYQIKLGQLLRDENHEDVQVFKVVQFIVHSGYPGGVVAAANDIAVIELDRDAELSDAVQIAKLGDEDECNAIEDSVLSGWGRTSSWSSHPVNLQWITMPRLTHEDCAARLVKFLGTSGGLDETMICIGANANKRESACKGDSGGPLVLKTGGALIGVVSWGISPCGIKDAPSVFTRVCSHKEFINEHVKDLL